MNAQPPVCRISDDEFDAMIGRGAAEILGRVELRDGALHRMNSQYVPHMRMKLAMFQALSAALTGAGSPLEVGVEATVRFGDGFSPLPDVFIWKPSNVEGTAPGADVALVVEVADSTLADDIGPKRIAYAKAGLPEYWVVDLKARALHRFSAPTGEDFAKAAVFREGEEVASDTLAGVAVTLAFQS
ncbi:MAG: Uma2 family endonuclease [Caulobacterales bacterium]|nr:Uma2 family endonuclease [Caulobacterales bacterium]